MDGAVALVVVLLGSAWSVARSRPAARPGSYSMIFSDGTQLVVNIRDCDGGGCPRQQDKGAAPWVRVLSSVWPAPPLLVCVLGGLTSPPRDVLWWADGAAAVARPASWKREPGGSYSAASIWEVPAGKWGSRSSYWCGTVQGEKVYKQKLC